MRWPTYARSPRTVTVEVSVEEVTRPLRARVEELEQDKIRLGRGHDAMAVQLTNTQQALQQTAQSLEAARAAQREAQALAQGLRAELAAGAARAESVTVRAADDPERLRVVLRGGRLTFERGDGDQIELEFTPAPAGEDDDDYDRD